MKIIKVAGIEDAAKELLNVLRSGRGDVLILLSGGSAIPIEVQAIKSLDNNNPTVGLVDERYGDAGHKDSNWAQLLKAGIRKDVKLLDVLSNLSIDETVDKYIARLSSAMQSSDYRIGIFGIGSDGHTAGILPNSPAVDSVGLVTHYKGPDFERITITSQVIKNLDTAILMAFGDEKQHQLQDLVSKDLDNNIQPAQMLKQAKELIIINDQIGG